MVCVFPSPKSHVQRAINPDSGAAHIREAHRIALAGGCGVAEIGIGKRCDNNRALIRVLLQPAVSVTVRVTV